MIRYQPPKSQVWGHQVGRLSAVELVDRCRRFLDEQCTILRLDKSEFSLAWKPIHDVLLSGVAAEVDQTIGLPTVSSERPAGDGDLGYRGRRWSFDGDKLPIVASWVDRLAALTKTSDVVVHSSTFWSLAWREEPPSERTPDSAFAVHLGRPHRLTTLLLFRDPEQYARIKKFLEEIGLVQLSDKHLRPKTCLDATKRRGKQSLNGRSTRPSP